LFRIALAGLVLAKWAVAGEPPRNSQGGIQDAKVPGTRKSKTDRCSSAIPISPTDRKAAAVGFTLVAANYDQRRYPAREDYNTCATCKFFEPCAGGRGICNALDNGVTPSGAWCSQWKPR
jgi:hypothetical protein